MEKESHVEESEKDDPNSKICSTILMIN
jgi:hypothetical protein